MNKATNYCAHRFDTQTILTINQNWYREVFPTLFNQVIMILAKLYAKQYAFSGKIIKIVNHCYDYIG